jgi:hypothetical protein
MELFELLEWVARLCTVAVAVYAMVSFKQRVLGILLGASILLIASYNVFPLGGEEGAGAWLHHTPLYIGMLLLAYSLNTFARSPQSQKQSDSPDHMLVGAGSLIGTGADSGNWLQLLTREGLQHIIVLPLFAGVLISVLVRSADAGPAYQRPMRWFLMAGGVAALIHIMEFIIESQNIIPSLEGAGVETLELLLVFSMLTLFAIAIRSAREFQNAQA